MADVGRPTKYNPKYDEQAFKLCLLGATDAELADFFEVAESTLNLWKLEHPNFSESIHAGKKIADMEVAHNLFTGTMDRQVVDQQAFKVKEVNYDANGRKLSETERVEVVDVLRTVPADFRNQQFWLKNRARDKWKDKVDHDITSGDEKLERTVIKWGDKEIQV